MFKISSDLDSLKKKKIRLVFNPNSIQNESYIIILSIVLTNNLTFKCLPPFLTVKSRSISN